MKGYERTILYLDCPVLRYDGRYRKLSRLSFKSPSCVEEQAEGSEALGEESPRHLVYNAGHLSHRELVFHQNKICNTSVIRRNNVSKNTNTR